MPKYDQYATLTSPAATDILSILDVDDDTMAPTGTTKQITVADLVPGTQAAVNLVNPAFGSNPSGAAGTQMNTAIAALPSAGGTILIPPGAWTLDEQVLFNLCPSGTVVFQGSGWGSRLLFSGSALGSAFAMGDTTQRKVFVRDLRISQTDGANDGTAVNANYCVDSSFERLLIDGSTFAPNMGISFNAAGTYYNVVRDSRINAGGSGGACVYIDTTSNSNVVDNCRLIGDASTTGVHANANGLAIIHPDFESTGLVGIAVGAAGINVTIIDAYVQSLATAISLASGCGPVTIIGGDADGATADITDSGCTALVVLGFRNAVGALQSYFGGSTSSGTRQLGFAASGSAPDVYLYRKAASTLQCSGAFNAQTNMRVAGLLIIDNALSTLGSGASQGVEIQNAVTPPGTTPTGGGVLYSAGGALHWLGSSGTNTTIASA